MNVLNPNDDRIFPGLETISGEYILCAAVWFNDSIKHEEQPKNIEIGFVVCGRRHGDCILTVIYLNKQIVDDLHESNNKAVMGFLTSYNRFVNRKEAGNIAFRSGQIKKKTDCLFSEDLY